MVKNRKSPGEESGEKPDDGMIDKLPPAAGMDKNASTSEPKQSAGEVSRKRNIDPAFIRRLR